LTEDGREGISGLWFRGLDESERARMSAILSESSVTFERFHEIIKGLYRTAHAKVDDMSSPNWALVVARQEGYKEALRDINNLLPKTKRKSKR
jgi:hypothetical protein